MDRSPLSPLANDIAAALDWWREAGVDCAFEDEPVNWLKPPETAPQAAPPPREQPMQTTARPAPAAPPVPAIGGDRDAWPDSAEAFAPWWLSEPSLDFGGSGPRVPPRGAPGAALMVLVPMPEREDRDTLLSGPQGELLARFLGKAEVATEGVYFAAALPRYMPHPDWSGLRQAGLGRIVQHHIALARPQRVLLMGNDIPPLLGHNPAQNPAFSLDLNHRGGSVPALAARSLEHMLNIPSARSRFWREWQDWTTGS